jgi:hypothetical protein
LPITATQDEQKKVEGYLMWKWGMQSKLPTNHTYYGAAP